MTPQEAQAALVEPDKIYHIAVPNLASNTQHLIAKECVDIARQLLEKNEAYGNSALEPVRVFSTASTREQLLVRIDDKLSRCVRGQAAGEDVVFDLIGYLVLLRVFDKLASF